MTHLILREESQRIGLTLSTQQLDYLEQYLGLLHKWNKAYNLTAIRNPQAMVVHHILDCLAVLPLLAQKIKQHSITTQNILDVGSGGGLPGVILAVCMPTWQVDCVDTVGKKAAFVQQVAASLGLKNLRGVHARVENLAKTKPELYGVICARAFASLPNFASGSQALLSPNGIWMALKGKRPDEEIKQLPLSIKVLEVETVQVPRLEAERCVVWLKQKESDV